MTDRRTQILDAAEAAFRRGGFDATSFRDVAAEVGIKSASVHHHFPTKADLGAAVVRRYADRFLEALGAPKAAPATAQARALAGAYREALDRGGAACLCAVLGAAPGALPETVREEIRGFFARLTAWAEAALRVDAATAQAVVAKLQGAMILTLNLDGPSPLEAAAREVEALGA